MDSIAREEPIDRDAKLAYVKLLGFTPSCYASYPKEWIKEGKPDFAKLLTNFKPFEKWTSALSSSLTSQTSSTHPFRDDPYRLKSVTIQARDMFGPNRIGFLKLSTIISNGAGETLPGAVFLRGASVAMMVRTESMTSLREIDG